MGKHRWKAAAVAVITALALSSTALAAPPSSPGANGNGNANANVTTTTGQPTYDCSSTSYSTVAQAVYCSHQTGMTGTALANAVHTVFVNEGMNTHGIQVWESVYTKLTSGTTGSTGGANPFSDMTAAPWATAAVNALQQAQVVDGTGNGQFSPNKPVTVAELATMLYRLQAGTAGSNVTVPTGTPTWAKDAMAWAQSNGVDLFQGIKGLGAPNSAATRSEAVLMLLNSAGLGPTASTQSGATINLGGTVPTWAHGGIALAIQLGLLKGSDGQVLANSPLTRAQMAVLLTRLATLESLSVNSGS